MGMYEGRGQLSDAAKELLIRWQQTRQVWNDAQRDAFEKTILEPLEAEVRRATSAMDHMSNLLHQVRKDCA